MIKSQKYILSPCGTSLLTNQAKDNEARKLIFKYANEKHKEKIAAADRAQLEQLIQKTALMLDTVKNQQAMKMSAEIHGIVQIYQGSISENNNDYHLLLSTDTWLGEETAKLVKKWLAGKNILAEVHRHTDLQTKDLEAFQLALSELIKKFSEEIPGFSTKGYKIIFNLTGGFKSVQGFLQSIANFFADETVYIFESSSDLMTIPRLPISLDAMPVISENINFFRNISIGLSDATSDNIPETLLFTLDNKTLLSPWGELLWGAAKNEIYKSALLPSPQPEKIKYSKAFIKTAEALPADRLELINNRIDQLNHYFFDNRFNPRSLDFKLLTGKKMLPSTHEIDAWSDKDAQRIFGHFEANVFILDKLDKGLH